MIRRKSKKRAVLDKEYMKLRKPFLENNPYCQVCESNISTDVHHTYCGANKMSHYLDVESWMAVCRFCHREIHDNTQYSKDNGYLK